MTSTRTLAAALLIALVASSPAAAGRAKSAPNIVFIMADDLGIHDLGCYGRTDQKTPNLDRLAKQGLLFRNAYAAAPLCSPTRAAILTGKAPARLHITTFLPGRADSPAQLLDSPLINQRLPADQVTLPTRLRSAGYISALIGKWHLGGKGSLPTDHGFHLYYPGKATTKPSATEGGKGEYELTEQAEKFIAENKTKPFFLALHHNNPHIALIAKNELIAKNKDAFNATYAAMIETLDDCVGRVLAKLDELGLAENTIVVFTSDNGGLDVLEGMLTPATFNALFRAGKGTFYEGGLRIPLLVRWPGRIPAGKEILTPVISTDWTPTFLSFAGIDAKESFDGISLVGLLTDGPAPPQRPLFWHMPHYSNQGGRPGGVVRLGDLRLVEFYDTGICELYDLKADPGEKTNIAAKLPAKVAELRGVLEKWRRGVGAQEGKANPRFSGKLWSALYAEQDPTKFPRFDTAAKMGEQQKAWRTLMNEAIGKKVEPGSGIVILHARDAKVHGKKLRYEPEPHKDTLGFWVDKGDWAEWTFDFPAAGRFEVELLVGCGKGSGGSEVDVEVAGEKLPMKAEETGHFQYFVPRLVGTISVKEAGKATLAIKVKTKPGPAVMDVRRVVIKSVS